MKRRLLHKTAAAPDHLFNVASALYTLWNIFGTWTNAILKIRRSSDNATAFVFFDGDTITLSSLISTTSDTTPDATTLGTWIGANNGFVERKYSQYFSNTIGHYVEQLTNGTQPRVIVAGVIEVENSLPTINYLSGTTYLNGTAITALNPGNEHTIFTVSSNKTSANLACIFTSNSDTTNFIAIYNDRSSSKLIANFRASSTPNYAELIAQQNSSSARLLSVTTDSMSNFEGFYNNVFQDSNTFTGSYGNNVFRLGIVGTGLLPLNGTIPLIIVMPSNLNPDISTYNNFINDYYSIY